MRDIHLLAILCLFVCLLLRLGNDNFGVYLFYEAGGLGLLASFNSQFSGHSSIDLMAWITCSVGVAVKGIWLNSLSNIGQSGEQRNPWRLQ